MPDIGALCRPCAFEIKPCDGLIPDHLHSQIDPRDAEAWVVDGFGGAHAVGAVTGIGRHRDRALAVLASSVSREHAELRSTETGWTVRDLGSRNGTFVDGVRTAGPVALPGRAQLRVGDVALWFIVQVIEEPSQQPMVTMDAGKGGFVRYRLTLDNLELSFVTSADDANTGTLLWRQGPTERWTERSLTLLEFQLLRTLCQRAQQDARSPSQIRGCVPSKELMNELTFQSKYANQENVRQVVMRLRNVLKELGGADRMLAFAAGRGYYLACHARMVALE